MNLEHEKFEGVKELAEISTKISAGTAALAQLKADEGTYLDEREVKLVERLKKTLVDSGDLIRAIGVNHDALVGYKNEVVDFYNKILSLLQRVMEFQALVEKANQELDERLTQQEQKAEAMRIENQRIKIQHEGERSELSAWRDRLGEKERKLNDSIATFERTQARIKTK